MMTDVARHLATFCGGLFLGLACFGGLWWSVKRVVRGDIPAWLWPLTSLLRVALAIGGFWWLSAGDLPRLACCLAGWLVARQLMVMRPGPRRGDPEEGGRPCT